MKSANTIFIFGIGYVGLHLAQHLAQQGWRIIATTRSPEKLSSLSHKNWTILPFDGISPVTGLDDYLSEASHLLCTISPITGHDPVLNLHREEIDNFTGWTGYLSATSIYPDQISGWVDETTPAAPATARGVMRLTAEQEWGKATRAEIFRIAGIYGPSRNPFMALTQGRSRIIDKPGHYFNRIHQSDISQIIIAAMAQPRPGRVINLCDKEPATQGDVIGYAAQLMGVQPPPPIPFEDANLTPMAKSFYVSRRRVRSHLLEEELGVGLLYPNYRSGLEAIYAEYEDKNKR